MMTAQPILRRWKSLADPPLGGVRRGYLAFIALAFAVGCSSHPTPEVVASSSSPSGTEVSRALQWTVTAPEHDAAFRQAFRMASERLPELVGDRAHGSWAVVLDADETILDNSTYEVERERDGLEFTREGWHEWCRREAATALPGAIDFLEQIHQLGGRIAIVTNRRLEVHEPTAANLRHIGAPFDILLSRVDEGDKGPRWQQVAEGTAVPEIGPLEIILWVGDNLHDFPFTTEDSGEVDLSPFGERFIVVPNPMYGSWQDNGIVLDGGSEPLKGS